jgi:hypothetical protein|tara:strand:- start:85 stop:237 length:153 start_codon:yes stop_codon:yes gene_type:complete
MSKDKKKTAKSSKDLLRDASTGVFYEGTKPANAGSPSGKRGGVPFWEVSK